ncbi:gfo/Idh/MocA family oxidoreductase (plasmid) [Deinococcus psychrotolerans]|uniref:Gfo/Idh/MocA family oxidoreductase n=1 Tax=Deinococcus psychrotolerans TaxID=2489213 RepID=A0A3G8YK06_9DEIO|nr:Gfo/Idh/MocA family oxidoreductase [Deinococcus psychrotolerans]AZI45050.1 gfo/Idh/MocA family oxidoreductase [Deinococcus psychrotolerans]
MTGQAAHPPRTLRVGLIGAGLMGQTHAEAWKRVPGALVANLALDGHAKALGERYGLKGYDTLQDLLAAVDVVDLCTPTPTHRELTLAAAEAGCHVICEKPAALSVADAIEMQRSCEANGVRLFVAHVLRFFPQYRAVKARFERGDFGAPRVLRLSRVSTPPTVGSWLLDEEKSGGVPMDLMVHDLDYARWIAGDVERVYAVQTQQAGKVMVQATLSHSGGAISLVEAGWAAPEGVFRTALDVAGTLGTAEWNSDAPAPLRRHGPALLPGQLGATLPALDGDPYGDQLSHAYAALRGGTPFLVSADDAVAAVALGQAVQQSVETGGAVTPQRWK